MRIKDNLGLRRGIQIKIYQVLNHEGGGGPQIAKPTCSTCGKKHFGKCLSGTSGCYGCGKNDHKVRDCPNIVAKGRNARQAPIVVLVLMVKQGIVSMLSKLTRKQIRMKVPVSHNF